MNVLRDFLLALADDEHLIGQQHTEWIGVAPFLEEDLAFSSIGQDELGHAALLYELVLEFDSAQLTDTPTDPVADAGTHTATDADIDAAAYDRDASDYRSSLLTEHTTNDWAEALVRHWVYDAAEELRWANVATSAYTPLSEIATRVQREEEFHRLHADALLDALLPHAHARTRLLDALDQILVLVPSVLAPVHGEAELVESGVIAVTTNQLRRDLAERTSNRFGVEVNLGEPPIGRRERSASFAPLMAGMREVLDYDPAAVW